MATQFEFSGGSLRLQRFPQQTKRPLQAWDAADTYLLKTLQEDHIQRERPMIFSDGFGALSLALSPYRPTLVTDSYLTRRAVEANRTLNDIDASINLLSPLDAWPENAGVVLIKIPKQLDYLEFILHRLRRFISPQTPILAAGMVKHLSRNTQGIFEDLLGPTEVSLAWKKARIFSLYSRLSLNPETPQRKSQLRNPDG